MNIMKKKPELLKKSGKSNVIIRKFLNNLKENDLHHENKQLTQCVFLGVLRLKPVPSMFSNVPSVSTTVDNSRPKEIKNNNSNREQNKNVSKKDNINKVLCGKVSKKNPQKVKAAVKKVPIKKPIIKIKLNTKKKPSTSSSIEAESSDMTNKSPDSIIARTTLTLNAMMSPTKFNPVQNLFDKLKQKRDEVISEPGPSRITHCDTKDEFKSSAVKFKVCKINANVQSSDCKKLKKNVPKKSYEKLSFPLISTSPITVSDTESTGKRDNDDIILLDENNSSNSNFNNENDVAVEDIIVINDDVPKSKERTSPRHKATPLSQEISTEVITDNQKFILVLDEQKLIQSANAMNTSQSDEVIVISDESKPASKPKKSGASGEQRKYDADGKDLIVIDEVREIRVSPRLRKNEEKVNENPTNSLDRRTETILTTNLDTSCDTNKKIEDVSKNEGSNIFTSIGQKGKTSPRLLKTIETESLTFKNELVESDVMIVNDKPKRKKSTMRPSTLLPPSLLNAPMLLRSELAPKKPNYTMSEKAKVRKTKDRVKDSSNKSITGSVKSSNKNTSMKLIDTDSKSRKGAFQYNSTQSATSSIPGIDNQVNVFDEVICIGDAVENKTRDPTSADPVNINEDSNTIIVDSSSSRRLTENQNLKHSNPIQEVENVRNDVIVLNNNFPKEKPKTTEIKIQEIKILKTETVVRENDDVIIVKEESGCQEKVSPRLLRSEFSKQQILQNVGGNKKSNFNDDKGTECDNIQLTNKGKSWVVNESVELIENKRLDNSVTTRVLRSNLKKSQKQHILMKDLDRQENISPKPSQPDTAHLKDQSLQDIKSVDLDEIVVPNERKIQKTSPRLLRSKLPQLNAQKLSEPATEEVVALIHDEPKHKPRSPASLKKSDQSKEVAVGPQKKNQVHETSPRSLRSDVQTKRKSPKNSKDLQASSVEKQSVSHRLLRSNIIKKELPSDDKNLDVDNVITSPRLLRSEKYSQRNSQNVSRHQSLNSKSKAKLDTAQKNSQNLSDEANKAIGLQEKPIKREPINLLENQGLTEGQTSSPKSSPSKRRSTKILNRQSQILAPSKKVVAAKKKARKVKSLLSSKTIPKTSMLLRSELAQLRTVTIDNKVTVQKNVKTPPKNSNKSIKSEPQSISKVSSKTRNKKNSPRSAKAKSVAVQTNDVSSNIFFESSDKLQENLIILDNAINVESTAKATNSAVVVKCEESKNNKSFEKNPKDLPPIENRRGKETIKRTSPRSSKNPSKRKLRETKSDEKCKTPEESVKIDLVVSEDTVETSVTCHSTTKTCDITIFDFDETEPELVPLRLNSTPKKEKPVLLTNKELEQSPPPRGDVTPKVRKQKAKDGSATKAQAKVKLQDVFDEVRTQQTNPKIPEIINVNNTTKTKSATKKKVINDQHEELSNSQNENVDGKKVKRKVPANKNSNPASKSDTRTSTSPLKQTTITDMFNRVKLKKENSVFEPTPEPVPQKERVASDMPPPKSERRPPPSNDRDEDEPYDEDSDCESRMEWIPEEYAEYKFKYSAKKMMTYKPIHKCKVCLLILPTYYKLSKHKQEHIKTENPYNCKHCDQAFSNVEDLSAHLRFHKGKHPYTCKKCDTGFWSKKSLDAHTPIHVLRKVKQPNKRFRCDVCAKEFSKLCDMERHTRVHTGEKPCVCNICNKRFQQSHNLSKHLLTHLHVKPFHCEICNKQFGRNDVLNRHLLTHSVDKPIKCSICSKGFIRQTQLNNHMKKNHSDVTTIEASPEPYVTEAK